VKNEKPGASIGKPTNGDPRRDVGPFEQMAVAIAKKQTAGRLIGKPLDPAELGQQIAGLARALDKLGKMVVNLENDRLARLRFAQQAAAAQAEAEREKAREREREGDDGEAKGESS
jgi:hypothetical protein